MKKIEGISLNWELELQIDENLGAYWTNLTGIAQMRTFVQELYNQRKLKVRTMDDRTLEKLRSSKREDKVIESVHNYDPLHNKRFSDQLFYSEIYNRTENQTSDFTTKALYVGEQE